MRLFHQQQGRNPTLSISSISLDHMPLSCCCPVLVADNAGMLALPVLERGAWSASSARARL